MRMKKISLFAAGLLMACISFGQREIPMPAIPAIRQLHHESIVNALTTISRFPLTKNDTLNRSINRSVKVLVNNMRAGIEINTALDNNTRFKWLRGINEMLSSFISGYRARAFNGAMFPSLVKAYDDAMRLDINGRSILGVVRDNPMEVGQILVDNYALQDNAGIVPAKDILVLKACQRDPDNVMKILKKYPNNRYADSLIIIAAFRDQEELYNYASDASSSLGKRIHSINHPLVKAIVRMSEMKTGRMYFPFLDDIYNGKITIDQITPLLKNDSSEYYSLLVKTRIGYAARMQHGDTPMAAKALVNKLHTKAVELYVNEINALHDLTNLNIRFKKLEGLSPEELYYIAVLSEDEIYTSSFVSGVYPRIIDRLGKSKSDSLLQLVHNDYYKKFLKMCAAYNTLDKFLDRMDKNTSQAYMKNFVSGLENTRTLEDAVDVADSYGSIYNKSLRKLILDQVQLKLAENRQKKNKRGTVIYNLLNTIFLSMDSSNHIDISAQLGINPIYTMPNQLLRDTAKRIVIQQFFYGDKDGRTFFDAFVAQFRNNPNWRVIRKPQWVEVQSARGAPVTIYSNLPLDEKQELDAKSQDELIAYLEENEIEPTVVIHRGHSYYLNSTISKLPSSGKVILVGSCGGYQMLNKVLEICPGAHIISSKQVGAGMINQGMINLIADQLRQGKDLNWPAIWRTLSGQFHGSAEEKFDDYVPPYKNLGAIFITAYNNAQ